MRKAISGLSLMLFAVVVNAQISSPVIWAYSAKKIAAKTYEIHLSAIIETNWHMYAQDADAGPGATTVSFTTNPLVIFDGNVKEIGKLEKVYDKNLKVELKYYGKKVDFVQKIKIRSTVATVIKGMIRYVVCDDRKCLPAKDAPFSINVGG